MSDLISRSNLIMRLSDYALQESPNDNESTGEQRISKMIYDAIQNCISCVEEQPTAYDIDKVIAKLEELDVKSITRYKNGNFGDFDGIEYYIKQREAIEIVKQGIVSDDVCEWEHDIQFEFAKSKCGFMDTHVIEFMKLKYCPYCGKKISWHDR